MQRDTRRVIDELLMPPQKNNATKTLLQWKRFVRNTTTTDDNAKPPRAEAPCHRSGTFVLSASLACSERAGLETNELLHLCSKPQNECKAGTLAAEAAARSIGLKGLCSSSYKLGSSSSSMPNSVSVLGQSLGNGFASLKSVYCGGRRQRFPNDACVHIGGTDTIEQLPIKSSIQKPGHITSGKIHMCKHIGTRPPTGIGSSRLWGVVHRGNIDEHIMLM